MQKLIKLSDTHYIIVDNSEVNVGEKVLEKYADSTYKLSETTPMSIAISKELVDKFQFRITHSTQPLEIIGEIYQNGKYIDNDYGFDEIERLSLSEVEEIINGYSVEELKAEFANKELKSDTGLLGNFFSLSTSFEEGFRAHQELVKDNFILTKSQLEDVLFTALNQKDSECCIIHTKDSIVRKIIQSLLPKTEWNVEFVDGKLKLL